MPNWCSNHLAIRGPKESVERFMENNKGLETFDDGTTVDLPLSFARCIPTPDQSKFSDMDYKQTMQEPDYWYNFHVNNWGTKWDLSTDTHVELQENEDGTWTAVYSFDTAWSPPEAWLETVAPEYGDLSIKLEYSEEGMAFAGVLGFHKGVQVERDSWEVGSHTDLGSYGELYG